MPKETGLLDQHQIKLRATRIAAGAFGAVLGLSLIAAAQTGFASRAMLPKAVAAAGLKETPRSQSLQAAGSTLVGHILDPAGAAVAGSRVILTNEHTGAGRISTSNDEGEYQFRSLEAGVYTLKADQAGFRTAVIEGIGLNGDDVKLLNVTLRVGDPGSPEEVVVTETSTSIAPLVKAAVDDDLTALKKLLEDGADVNTIDDYYHASALAMAVYHGNLEMVQTLLGAGADANRCNGYGQTPLMYLSNLNSGEIVKALVKAGAKLDQQDEDGDTALISVASGANKEALQALLDAGAAVNMKNNDGATALIMAAKGNYIEHVRALIMAGADVYERDAGGKTALTYAREQSNREMVKLLRTYGAVEYLR